ncbi:Glyoxalase-like domain protein [compost metagenome]
MSIGGQNLALAGPRESAVEKGAIVVFEVDSLDTAASAIASAGGRVLSQRDMGDHGRTLTFADPSGNICQLFQRA